MTVPRNRVAGLLVGVAVAMSACGGPERPRPVTVLAASNVTALVEALAADADVAVAVSGAGTPQLAAQVRANGVAGVDLLLLADREVAVGLARDVSGVPTPRAWVSTAVALVGTDPALTQRPATEVVVDPDLTWVVADEGVPLGDATREALGPAFASVAPRVLSLESSALDVLAKVRAGAADLAVVYLANAMREVTDGDLVLVATWPVRVVTHQQALTPAGEQLASILRADVEGLRSLGFEPAG